MAAKPDSPPRATRGGPRTTRGVPRATSRASRPDRAQGLVEYGLILALSGALTVVWLGLFGGAIAEMLAAIGTAIDSATGG